MGNNITAAMPGAPAEAEAAVDTQHHPPERFAMVEEGVYRSNAITTQNFSFIQTLQLKTVLLLSPEMPLRAVTNFLKQEKVQLVQLGLKIWSPESSPVSDELVKGALEYALDAQSHPLLIMCSSGMHRTGVVLGCLRRMQQWNLAAVIEEYRSFCTNETARYINEQFIDCFDLDLVNLPSTLPLWWMQQARMLEAERQSFSQCGMRRGSTGPMFMRHYFDVTGPLVSTAVTLPEGSQKKKKDKKDKKHK